MSMNAPLGKHEGVIMKAKISCLIIR